jgi:hypothetical protein
VTAPQIAVDEDGWIATSASQPTTIAVGDIGFVELAPGTKLRRIEGSAQHHYELQQGTMHARVEAQPRVFVVETPSASAVDLGCEYLLTVDEHGNSRLFVQTGFVAFERDGLECIVPGGAACETRVRGRIGTAFWIDADSTLRAALSDFDFADLGARERARALATVLERAVARDALTLWHLVARTQGAERLAVVERLAVLAPPPAGVTREAALAGDREAMDAWWAEILRLEESTRATIPPR